MFVVSVVEGFELFVDDFDELQLVLMITVVATAERTIIIRFIGFVFYVIKSLKDIYSIFLPAAKNDFLKRYLIHGKFFLHLFLLMLISDAGRGLEETKILLTVFFTYCINKIDNVGVSMKKQKLDTSIRGNRYFYLRAF